MSDRTYNDTYQIFNTGLAGISVEGATYRDSTQSCLAAYLSGVKQFIPGVLYSQTNTVTVSNTAAETTLVGTGIGTVTLPANFFKAGKSLVIKAGGFYGTDAVASGNFIRIKLGATTILISAGDTLNTGIGNNRGWFLDAIITCRSVGATGTVIGQGLLTYSIGGSTTKPYPLQNLATVTIDTTASLAVGLTTQWGTANANNIMNLTNLLLAVWG